MTPELRKIHAQGTLLHTPISTGLLPHYTNNWIKVCTVRSLCRSKPLNLGVYPWLSSHPWTSMAPASRGCHAHSGPPMWADASKWVDLSYALCTLSQYESLKITIGSGQQRPAASTKTSVIWGTHRTLLLPPLQDSAPWNSCLVFMWLYLHQDVGTQCARPCELAQWHHTDHSCPHHLSASSSELNHLPKGFFAAVTQAHYGNFFFFFF